MEKWYEIKKGADFQAIAERFGISPVTARLIRNRGVIGDAAIDKYLNGTCRDLYDPHLLYESEKLVCILSEKIRQGRPIRIIGDYDIDGVMSTYILYQGITRCGGSVSCAIPDRMRDGYGINEHLIDAAYEEGMDTIITCDNGIAAINEIAHAKELGMTVLVTDHHEIPYVEEQGVRRYLRSAADAIVNPKQQECSYPYKGLCGATVAWKIIQLLYEKFCIDAEEAFAFLEFVAFATVGDVMELTDENRILVREGLKRLHRTANLGMRALILQNQICAWSLRQRQRAVGDSQNCAESFLAKKRDLCRKNCKRTRGTERTAQKHDGRRRGTGKTDRRRGNSGREGAGDLFARGA